MLRGWAHRRWSLHKRRFTKYDSDLASLALSLNHDGAPTERDARPRRFLRQLPDRVVRPTRRRARRVRHSRVALAREPALAGARMPRTRAGPVRGAAVDRGADAELLVRSAPARGGALPRLEPPRRSAGRCASADDRENPGADPWRRTARAARAKPGRQRNPGRGAPESDPPRCAFVLFSKDPADAAHSQISPSCRCSNLTTS